MYPLKVKFTRAQWPLQPKEGFVFERKFSVEYSLKMCLSSVFFSLHVFYWPLKTPLKIYCYQYIRFSLEDEFLFSFFLAELLVLAILLFSSTNFLPIRDMTTFEQ